ncbi:uncharacterized protein LOC135126334 isoform X3 [Zophobas morio]|uniref:uncharacterized protein LOC135126334 isoform X3 n=1 Tax=Zophobas morio TaxID=2755281 RepID=UPI003083DE2D
MLTKLNFIKIISLVIASFKYSCCENVFFVVNEYAERGSQFYCITNSSRALSWVTEDTTFITDLQQGSRFLSVEENLWKVDSYEIENHGWKYGESVADEIITDQRWENIQINKTDYVDVSSTDELQFLKILELKSANFKVPLSIRTNQEAHIFLCDGVTVTSNCYWFLLQAFEGTVSGVRKCPIDTIPTKNNVYPKKPCYDLKVSIKHGSQFPKFLSRSAWQHFMLVKENNKISLIKQDGQEIISYTDNENIRYKVNNILIHSKRSAGLWKIHEVKYFTTSQSKKTHFNMTLLPVNGKICITAFIKMCENCKIKFVIINADNEKHILGQATYQKVSQWTQIRFITNAIGYKRVTLAIITDDETSSDHYWAIQEIQQCEENGLRMIYSETLANCQLLSSDNKVISLDNAVATSYPDKYAECAESTISTHCVPCNLFVIENCGKLKVCENNQNELLCSCSAGYKTDDGNINCQTSCDPGTYGHYCTKTCNTNCQNCDTVDGMCTDCSNSYMGTKCDVAPMPFFKNSPEIKSFGYTEAEIVVNNFKLETFSFNADLLYKYTVQYKEATATNWTFHPYIVYVGISHTFTIENLKPGVKYYVRSIIIEYETNYDDIIPTADFVTKCDVVSSDDFQVEATSTTALLFVKKDRNSRICKFLTPETNIEIRPNISESYYYLEGMTLNINGLRPFEVFNLTIKNKNTVVERSFRTTEGVPDAVTNVIARAITDSEIVVGWNAPRNLYGNFRDFVVSYKIIKFLTCDSAPTVSEAITKTSTKPSIILSNLNPHTLYSISVKARNTKLSGLAETEEQSTLQSDKIRDQEIPKASLKKTNSRSVEIEFSNVPCGNLGAPLEVVTVAVCLTNWCKNQNVSNSLTYPQHKTLILNNVTPFTNYQLKVEFHRNNFSKIITFGSFKTKAEAPYAVNNLSVYSKNTHSISVRWRPPSPPTGIVNLYQIKLLEEDRIINVTDSPCFLWSEYQCYTFENLKEKQRYSVQLTAKNEEPDRFGQYTSVQALTETEPAEKPPDVMVKWTLENDVNISWKHPVVANGDIQSFKIVFEYSSKQGRIDRFLNITKSQYKPTYQMTVKLQTIQTSTPYKVVIRAYNGLDGDEAYFMDVSPPEIPLLEADPTIVNVSSNTVTLQVEKSKNFNPKNTYKLFLLVSDESPRSDFDPSELQKLESHFGSLSPGKVVFECNNFTAAKQFVIGRSNEVANCRQDSNITLTTGTSYNVTVLLVSTYQNKSSYKLYSKSALTSGEPLNSSWDLRFLALLFLLLILIPVFYIYSFHKKKMLAASGQDAVNFELTSSVELRLNVAGLDHLQSKPIRNRKFNNYVKTNLENRKLAAQHNAILQTTAAEYEEIGEKTYLERIDLDFTTGHRIPEVYAICDVPKDFDTFWKLVWSENIEHIVLLDNLQWQQIRKYYWPKFGLSLDIKNILVHCIHEEIFTDHEYRTFKLTYQDQTRVIDQLRFTAWIDFDLPHSLTFVNFFKKMSVMSLNKTSPILVHCSTTRAGTGFALLCDMCLRISKKDNVVDVFKNSQILKDSNFNLIDSYKCYQLAHLVILECLLSFELDVEVDLLDNKSEPSVLSEKELKKYLTYMKNTAWIDELSPDKNRDSNIYFRVDAPRYEGELLLRPYSPDEEIDSFLSSLDGVIIDDCSCPKKYILLKHPQQNNLEQFWTMVSKVDVSVIINLNENDFFGANLLLNQGGLQVSKTLILKLVIVTHFKCYDWITVRVLIDGQKHSKDVKVFWMKNWSGEKVCPPSVEDFVEFCIETSRVTAVCNSVLITCRDGATASGLYVAMSYNIENFKKENKCVICTSARLVRRYRHQFATKDEQLKFLWEATEYFVQQFKLYETL